MAPDVSRDQSRTASPVYGERFTQRLEAFSDLVFGFSLSLLATRLDVPANPAEVFETTRWATFIATFGMICAIWLSHYRIFRASLCRAHAGRDRELYFSAGNRGAALCGPDVPALLAGA